MVMKNPLIKYVTARAVIDCKGKPLLEVDILTDVGILGRGASPSGISAGKHEAFVLRDGDNNWYNGAGVFKAVDIVKTLVAPALIGMNVMDQTGIDNRLIELDRTPNKSRLGGNTTYSVSLAAIRAATQINQVPLYRHLNPKPINTIPIPTSNCFSGGSYQKNSMPLQECTIIPWRAKTMQEAVHILVQVYGQMPIIIKEYQNGRPAVPGSLSAFTCPSQDPAVAFEIIEEAAKRVNMLDKIAFAADYASSEFFDSKRNVYNFVGEELDSDGMIDKLVTLTERFPFLYVEDPIQENDWEGWEKASKTLKKTILIGDDLTVTNIEKLRKAVNSNACGGFIFKPNQIGTITECIIAQEYAHKHGLLSIPSIRAGGINDDPIVDMAIAFGCCAIKQGPPRNGQSIHCINTLLRVEDIEIPVPVPFDFSPYVKFGYKDPRN
jgi:enolase